MRDGRSVGGQASVDSSAHLIFMATLRVEKVSDELREIVRVATHLMMNWKSEALVKPLVCKVCEATPSAAAAALK